jgi:hypothetical protein
LPVWSLLEQPIESESDPSLAIVALFALSASDGSGFVRGGQPTHISNLLTAMRKRMAIKFPGPNLTDFDFALAGIAQTDPSALDDGDLKTMVDMYADESLYVFTKWDLIRAMTRFGLCDNTLAPKIFQAFLQIAVDEDFGARRKNGTAWLTDFVLVHAAILAKGNPASVTVQSLSPLSVAATRPLAQSRVGEWAIPLSFMAKGNPSVIDAGIAHAIVSGFKDPKSDAQLSARCAIALTRLGALRPDLRLQSAEDKTIAIANTGDLSALSAASEVATKYQDSVRNTGSLLTALFKNMSKSATGSDSHYEISEDDPMLGTEGAVATVSRLAAAKPEAIGSNVIEEAVRAIENPRSTGTERLAAMCLIPLAASAPNLMASYAARLNSLKLATWSGSSPEDIHGIVTAAASIAMYHQARNSAKPIETLLSWLDMETVPDKALEGAYGVFLADLDDEQVSTSLRPRLTDWFRTGEPRRRMAAAKALEMLSIADLYHNARRFGTNSALDRAKLSLLGNYLEPHISISAQIALSRLD